MAKKRDYEVGYGKPPKATRFKPGQSGNPKGRPKGALGLKAMVRKVFTAPVKVKVAGKTRSMPAMEAITLRLCQRALEGDFRSMTASMGLGGEHLPDETEKAAVWLAETDRQIFETYFRLRAPQTEASSEKSDGRGSEENDDE
ncbi:MAG TPA: DUF5681 domain-containing protein [Sphingomicrobium sp.]|jgi:hypothetical protein|nr:DUF5681 domain-containing protein [Sphingomicrobium sp.]